MSFMGLTVEWLRPMWLWGLLPLLLLLIFFWRSWRQQDSWASLVDPALQSYVIEGEGRHSRWPLALLAAAWTLSLLLLAGPVWQQREVPVYAAEQSQVVLLDLSRSMLADDLAPNRLTRARFKLIDLLQRSQGRQSGLIAFAERPYVISPLTDDAATMEAFVPSLSPAIMPAQGSRMDLAIERAVQLLQQASVDSGHIVLMTDGLPGTAAYDAARQSRDQGHIVSVLMVGTAAGAPLRDEEGLFLQDASGSVVVAGVDSVALQALANAGGGVAVTLDTSAADLDALDAVFARVSSRTDEEEQASTLYWVEQSAWLLWPLLVVVLLGFRRGVVA